jgi:hypothetical protein
MEIIINNYGKKNNCAKHVDVNKPYKQRNGLSALILRGDYVCGHGPLWGKFWHKEGFELENTWNECGHDSPTHQDRETDLVNIKEE